MRFMIHTYGRGNRLREVRYLVHECTARLESSLSDSQGWAPNQALEFHGHPPTPNQTRYLDPWYF